MSCLYRKIIVVAIWQHWTDKVTFFSFFVFVHLIFRFLQDFLRISDTNITIQSVINILIKNINNVVFLVLD